MKFADLSNKNIIVTGASSGLGQATSILLSKLGARLCIIGRNELRLRETFDDLTGDGHYLRCFDFNSLDGCGLLIQDIIEKLGKISGFVHFAGIRETLPLKVLKNERLDRIMHINFYSYIEMVRQITNKRNNTADSGCSILAVSSVAAQRGGVAMTAYSASKAALDAAVKCLAAEFSARNIRFNCLVPGHVDTPMNEKVKQKITHESFEKIISSHPLGQGQPKDVASLAAFLLSNEADWITGSLISVDGGFLAC